MVQAAIFTWWQNDALHIDCRLNRARLSNVLQKLQPIFPHVSSGTLASVVLCFSIPTLLLQSNANAPVRLDFWGGQIQ